MQLKITLCLLALCMATVMAGPRGGVGGKSGEKSGGKSGEKNGKGPCKIVDPSGEVTTVNTCSCTVGPVEATYNGATVQVFFCERIESAEESTEEVTEAPAVVDLDKLASGLVS